MLGWLIQTTIVSILIIFLAHHLVVYFQQTLTIPKVKDLVSSSSKNYEEILQTLSNSTPTTIENIIDGGSTTYIDLLPTNVVVGDIDTKNANTKESMKEDLKSIFKEKLLNTNA